MSNLSDLIPAGGGQNNTDFVADGAIASGKPVILTAAGKAAEVVATAAEFGTPVDINTTSGATYTGTAFDSTNNKIVVAFRDGAANAGKAAVGTVSGTSISFGSDVEFTSNNATYVAATYDSSTDRVVIAYRDASNSDYGTAVVGTVSGTSISFGTPVVFETASSPYISLAFDSNSNKVVIAYTDEGNSSYATAIVGTVSGTSISFGTAVVFESANTQYISATFDSNSNKVVIAYKDTGNSNYGTGIVGTVSGTSISFGTAAVFASADTDYCAATFDSNENKVVIGYRDEDNSSYGTAVVGTVSGTAISFGSEVVFESAVTAYIAPTFDSNSNKVVISYQDTPNSTYGTGVIGTVSGTAISFGTPVVFDSAISSYISSAYDSNANMVVIGLVSEPSGGGNSYPTAVVYGTPTNLTATNLLGIAAGAILDTATGTINTWGSRNEVQSGLTIASDYYAQGDGTITTSSSGQLLGKALSATQINIKDYTG